MCESFVVRPQYLELRLKTQGKRSHNLAKAERRMVILVELLARRAAEEDFKKLHGMSRSRYLH